MRLFWRQVTALWLVALRQDYQRKDIILAPILLAALLAMILGISIEVLANQDRLALLPAITATSILVALQMTFYRIFECDSQDSFATVLTTYPVSAEAWFLARCLLGLTHGCLVIGPTVVVSLLVNNHSVNSQLLGYLFLVSMGMLFGLTALGVLVSGMVSCSEGRAGLFPLLFYPLGTPVLVSALSAIQFKSEVALDISWLGIMASFSIVFFGLGLLLFSQLVGSLVQSDEMA